jgi:UDP-N-acetyl-2-amino-2-deoxyglucuronate dehydrogenase
MRYALIGAAGYIAPRHMKAIKETGGELVAAIDPHDAVGVIDSYSPPAHFFTEIERFDRHLSRLYRTGQGVDFISVCSPNYLHDAHIRFGLRLHADVICEKPLVIQPHNLDELAAIEQEYQRHVYTVLQLRQHPKAIALKAKLTTGHKVSVRYVTPRGRWYGVSWKGCPAKSGGVAMNIGVHLFDLLLWLLGPVEKSTVTMRTDDKMSGVLELAGGTADWLLSLDAADGPGRSIIIDGEPIALTGFTELHTRVYEEILAGRGTGIDDARPSIELVNNICNSG